MENNNWQKCPVCNGSGVSHVLHGYMYSCGTCDGHGIINIYDGAPPSFKKYQTSIGNNIGMTGESGHPSITGETIVKKEIAYAVIPNAERLDIGTNKPVAVFKIKEHAEQFSKSLYQRWYIIEEIKTDIFYENTNM